jgi:choline kinase
VRAIILAAGRGSRLGQAVERPKCLLEFGGRTLLERHLAILADLGVDEVVLVLGFEHGQVEAELARLGREDVEVLINDRYALGSVLTMHVARDAVVGVGDAGGDVLVMDADVLYDPRILERLVSGASADRLLIDRGFIPGDEPVKVCVKAGVPVEFRKRLPPDLVYDTIGESVGFFRFRPDTARRFANIVARYVDTNRVDQPHEEAIRDLLFEGVAGLDVADVTGLAWIEIDFPDDVKRAANDVLPRIDNN